MIKINIVFTINEMYDIQLSYLKNSVCELYFNMILSYILHSEQQPQYHNEKHFSLYNGFSTQRNRSQS